MSDSLNSIVSEQGSVVSEQNFIETKSEMEIPGIPQKYEGEIKIPGFHHEISSSDSNNGTCSGSSDIADDSYFENDLDSAKTAGRWTKAEHELFLSGLKQHDKQWKLVASVVKTRTVVQVRTHAQKYFQKIGKSDPNSIKKPLKKSIIAIGGVRTVTTGNYILSQKHAEESDDNVCSLSGVTTSSTCSNHSVSTDEGDTSDVERGFGTHPISDNFNCTSSDSSRIETLRDQSSFNVMRTQSLSAMDTLTNRQPGIMLNVGCFTDYNKSGLKSPQKRSRDDRSERISTAVSHIVPPTMSNMNAFNGYCLPPSNDANCFPINRCYSDLDQHGHNNMGSVRLMNNKPSDEHSPTHLDFFYSQQQPPSDYDDPNDQKFLSLLGDIDWQSMNHSNSLSPGSSSPQQMLGLDPECRAASPLFAPVVIDSTHLKESKKISSEKESPETTLMDNISRLDNEEVAGKNNSHDNESSGDIILHRKPPKIVGSDFDDVTLDTKISHSSDSERKEGASSVNEANTNAYFATPLLNVGQPSPYAFDGANSSQSSLQTVDRVVYDSAGQYSIFKIGISSSSNNSFQYPSRPHQPHHFKSDRSWIVDSNSSGYHHPHMSSSSDDANRNCNISGSSSSSNSNMMDMLRSFSTDELHRSMPALTLSSTSGIMMSPPEKLANSTPLGVDSKPVRRRGRPRKITVTSSSPSSALLSSSSNPINSTTNTTTSAQIITHAEKPAHCSFPPISFHIKASQVGAAPPSDDLFRKYTSTQELTSNYCSSPSTTTDTMDALSYFEFGNRIPINGLIFNETNHNNNNPPSFGHQYNGTDMFNHNVDCLSTRIDDDFCIGSDMLEAFDA